MTDTTPAPAPPDTIEAFRALPLKERMELCRSDPGLVDRLSGRTLPEPPPPAPLELPDSLETFRSLPFDERIQLTKQHPDLLPRLRAGRPSIAPAVATWTDFELLSVAEQMDLAVEEPARYEELRAQLSARLAEKPRPIDFRQLSPTSGAATGYAPTPQAALQAAGFDPLHPPRPRP